LIQRGLAGLVLRHHAFAGDDEAMASRHMGDRRRRGMKSIGSVERMISPGPPSAEA
jgi:hypothetical protein